MYNKYAELRDAKGLTDYAVAKETGIATATLSSWKNGIYEPKIEKLAILARFFGVSVDYFLNNKETE